MTEKAITCDHESCDEWANRDGLNGWYVCYPSGAGRVTDTDVRWLCPMHATSAFGVTKTLAPTGTTIIDPVQLQRSTPKRGTVHEYAPWEYVSAYPKELLGKTIKRQPEVQSPLRDPQMWSIMSAVLAALALLFSLIRLR